MKKNDYTYTIAEIDTMLDFYDAQRDFMMEYLEVSNANGILASFVDENKKRLPSRARLDIKSYYNEIGSTLQDILNKLDQKIDTLSNMKTQMIDDIADMYGINSYSANVDKLIDEYNEQYEDYISALEEELVEE